LQPGHQQFDGATFAGVIAGMPNCANGRIEQEGVVTWCLDTQARLRERGIAIGIDSPSFNCSSSSSPGERLVCADATLWALDRAIARTHARRGSRRSAANGVATPRYQHTDPPFSGFG
jgi:hypothetical protein